VSDSRLNGNGMVGLLEVEPELRKWLSVDECQLASRVTIPVHTFTSRALDLDQLLDNTGAFGAVILDGVLLHRMSIGDQPALRLLGRGDLVSLSGSFRTAILGHSSYRASGQLRLAMLDDRVLLTARRFPRLFAALQIRLAEQHQRLAAQLVICQLPRVEDRLLALMWLLAETWGRVTASGTVLPLALTHDALGELIGARRPTVTLALKELADRGSLFRQDGEWLLLEPPPQGPGPAPVKADPELTSTAPTRWACAPAHSVGPREAPPGPAHPEAEVEQLAEIILALRERHERNTGDTRNRLEWARRTRERTRSLREEIARQRLSRGWRPPARRPAP
jgi:CRP/FNR family transcriptional regulator, cyclic AMP receptor protein